LNSVVSSIAHLHLISSGLRFSTWYDALFQIKWIVFTVRFWLKRLWHLVAGHWMNWHAFKRLLFTAKFAPRAYGIHGLVKFFQVFVVVSVEPGIFALGMGSWRKRLIRVRLFEGFFTFNWFFVFGCMHE